MKAQWLAGLPRGDGVGLCGLSLRGCIILTLLFGSRLLSAIELQDRTDPDLPRALFGVCLLAGIFPAAQLAFNLDMCAFGQRFGELRELAEDDATVPLSVRDVLVAVLVLVGGLCCQREGGEAAVVCGANFCIVAEEANEGYFVLVDDSVSVFEFPILLGSHRAEPSERPPAPKRQALHLRWVRQRWKP